MNNNNKQQQQQQQNSQEIDWLCVVWAIIQASVAHDIDTGTVVGASSTQLTVIGTGTTNKQTMHRQQLPLV